MHSIHHVFITCLILAAGCGEVVPAQPDCQESELVCDGVCVDVTSHPDHCGACGNVCGGAETCVAGACETLDAVEVAIDTAWPATTGWTSADDQPIEMSIRPVDIPGATYLCRTGHVAIFGSLEPAPCDGGDGTTPVHRPSPSANLEQGSYRTEVRVRVGDWESEPVFYDYYVHSSLDGAPRCDTPFTDEEIFALAKEYLETPTTFPEDTRVRNPFIRLPFNNVIVTSGMIGGSPNKWSNVKNYLVEVNSLRRRFSLSPDRTLLLIQRRYASRRAIAYDQQSAYCDNGFYFGNKNRLDSTSPAHGKVDCQNFVLNARGQSVCLNEAPNNPGELTLRLSSEIGYVKLQKHGSFSAKGPQETCPAKYQSACTWYLELPQ